RTDRLIRHRRASSPSEGRHYWRLLQQRTARSCRGQGWCGLRRDQRGLGYKNQGSDKPFGRREGRWEVLGGTGWNERESRCYWCALPVFFSSVTRLMGLTTQAASSPPT